MTLDQLIMFKTVADFGSLRNSSEQLHKSQAAISQGVRQLESSLGVTLFNRSAYRLALTESGKMIYQHALRLLDEASMLQQIAGHISEGNETSITIAIEATFNLKVILPLLESIQRQFHGTQIVLRQEYLTGAMDAVNNQQATLCISPIDTTFQNYDNLDSHFLTEGLFINVASPKLLVRHPNLTSSRELLDEYQIIVQDTGKGSKDQEWGVQDGQRRWYVNDFATKTTLIESGIGWGKLPNQHAKSGLDSGTLITLPLNDVKNIVKFNHYIVRNKKQMLGPVASALWEQFKSYNFDNN